MSRICPSCREVHPSAAYVDGAVCILCPQEVRNRTGYTGPRAPGPGGNTPRDKYLANQPGPEVQNLIDTIAEYQSQRAWEKELMEDA